jgi:hypothetical protein
VYPYLLCLTSKICAEHYCALGTVEAERFITLMLREPFDYTKWQRHLWADKSIEEISKVAMALRRTSLHKGMEPTR